MRILAQPCDALLVLLRSVYNHARRDRWGRAYRQRWRRENSRGEGGLGAPATRGGISAERDWAMDIRIITEHDVEEFIRLRLEALTREPYAFARALEDERSRSPESVAPRLRAALEGNFVVGAFEGRYMVGQAGFVRYEGRKERHKGTIWGVY